MAVGMLYRQPQSYQTSGTFEADEYMFARDVATTLVNSYSELVWQTTSPYLSSMSAEFAYGRLLGTRGALCRICPHEYMKFLAPRTLESWETAESRLHNHFSQLSEDDVLYGVARQVEARWTQSVEAFLRVMSARVMGDEIPEQLGLLRGIDSIALHLAQRELFQWSQYFSVTSANTKALKLRIRLFALFLSTRRLDFNSSYPAIRSYRETFGIADRHAYPWWFVDCDLTERQMNWTHRRLNNESLGWRF